MKKTLKITKGKFEDLISKKLNLKVVEYRPYHYFDYKQVDKYGQPKEQKMTLYYKDGDHIGSWNSGNGWYLTRSK
tara:strand:+ start:780 stop:1004 length:225 start_codon:yes stop_codon:yes gene_type:complete